MDELEDKPRVDMLKELMLGAGKIQNDNRISEKTLETVTLKESLRLGNISKSEQYRLSMMLGYNTIYFKSKENMNKRQAKMTCIERMVDDYLNLSTSVNGKLLFHIGDMFKTTHVISDADDVKRR